MTVRATDSVGAVGTTALSITVNPSPSIQGEGLYGASGSEGFDNGYITTSGLTVTIGGVNVPRSARISGAGFYSSYAGSYCTGWCLELQNITQTLTITFPSGSNPTTFSFLAGAVNGNQTGTVRFNDGTTTKVPSSLVTRPRSLSHRQVRASLRSHSAAETIGYWITWLGKRVQEISKLHTPFHSLRPHIQQALELVIRRSH